MSLNYIHVPVYYGLIQLLFWSFKGVLVPMQKADYSDMIWCDVLPMPLAHVLLEEISAAYNEKYKNLYIHIYPPRKGKALSLNCVSPKKNKVTHESPTSIPSKQHCHIPSSTA